MAEWQDSLRTALQEYQKTYGLAGPHFAHTPKRVVQAYADMVSGMGEVAHNHLRVTFPCGGDSGMVHVAPIRINSTCAHHLMPVIGIAHFAYIPGKEIVGLSKIPRFIDSLSRRLQTQEDLGQDIVNIFDMILKPLGCAVWIKAYHCCMSVRGANEHEALTRTMTLRGVYHTKPEAKAELLAAIDFHMPVIG